MIETLLLLFLVLTLSLKSCNRLERQRQVADAYVRGYGAAIQDAKTFLRKL